VLFAFIISSMRATYPAHPILLYFIILSIFHEMRFDAFPATEYDEVFSGYQLGQMVER
jgi:hypothetical protein